MPTAEQYPAQQITNRRAELARYRAAYAERYGYLLDAKKHEAADHLLAVLEGRP